LIDRLLNGGLEPAEEVIRKIRLAQSPDELDAISNELRPVWRRYSEKDRDWIRQAGKLRRGVVRYEF